MISNKAQLFWKTSRHVCRCAYRQRVEFTHRYVLVLDLILINLQNLRDKMLQLFFRYRYMILYWFYAELHRWKYNYPATLAYITPIMIYNQTSSYCFHLILKQGKRKMHTCQIYLLYWLPSKFLPIFTWKHARV